MSYLDRYNWRIETDGKTLGDALRNNTHYLKNKNFNHSMTHRNANYYINKDTDLQISGTKDIRVIEIDRQGSIRNVLFRIGEELRVGNILEFDDELWLAYDKYGSLEDDIKLRVARINDKLIWQDRNGEIFSIPSISTIATLGSNANSNDGGYFDNAYNVNTPEGQILVFVELNEETKKINLNQRFIIGSKVYKVVYVDDISMVDKDYYGVLKLILRVDLKYNNKDDFENSIAYNDYFEKEESSMEAGDDNKGGEDDWGW